MPNMNTQLFYSYGRMRTAGFCDELVAIIDYAVFSGIAVPPSETIIETNKLIKGLLEIDYLQTRDSFVNLTVNDLTYNTFTRLDWKRLSAYQQKYVNYGGVIDTVSGVEGNGVNGYISPELDLAYLDHYQLNNCHRSAVVYKAGNVIDGSNDGYNRLLGISSTGHRVNSNTSMTTLNFAGTGYTGISRINSNDLRCFKKESEFLRTQPSFTLPSYTYLFRSANSYGTAGISHYDVGSAVTQTQVQAFRELYNTYLVNIGLTAYA